MTAITPPAPPPPSEDSAATSLLCVLDRMKNMGAAVALIRFMEAMPLSMPGTPEGFPFDRVLADLAAQGMNLSRLLTYRLEERHGAELPLIVTAAWAAFARYTKVVSPKVGIIRLLFDRSLPSDTLAAAQDWLALMAKNIFDIEHVLLHGKEYDYAGRPQVAR